MTGRRPSVFTIGHSAHAMERFRELLRRHEIAEIAEVRSAPSSRRYP